MLSRAGPKLTYLLITTAWLTGVSLQNMLFGINFLQKAVEYIINCYFTIGDQDKNNKNDWYTYGIRPALFFC